MEIEHVRCTNCGAAYSFVTYKTGIGKTEAQLEQMRLQRTFCKICKEATLIDVWLEEWKKRNGVIDDDTPTSTRPVINIKRGKSPFSSKKKLYNIQISKRGLKC